MAEKKIHKNKIKNFDSLFDPLSLSLQPYLTNFNLFLSLSLRPSESGFVPMSLFKFYCSRRPLQILIGESGSCSIDKSKKLYLENLNILICTLLYLTFCMNRNSKCRLLVKL